MPLTGPQRQIFQVLAALRSAESVVAGGIPIAREAARISKDIDLFHGDTANTQVADRDLCGYVGVSDVCSQTAS